MKMDIKTVVVLHTYKTFFDSDELTSLESLKNKLSHKYPIVILCPTKNKNKLRKNKLLDKYSFMDLPEKYFTYKGYNELCKSSFFYEIFKKKGYEYMLIYQTDCFVFGNSLTYWINKKYDYVGAPWFRSSKNGKILFEAVGNGGLSLRKIDSFIKVTRIAESFKGRMKIFDKNFFSSIKSLFYKLFIYRWQHAYLIMGKGNEDVFFSFVSNQLVPNFRIAPYKDALKFAFELQPEFAFNQNNKKLPFGVHAFAKNNPAFWKRFIKIKKYNNK